MARTLKVYNGEDQSPVTDITDLVEWPDSEFGHRAHMGESTLSNIRFRDEDGRVGNAASLPAGLTAFALNAHNVVVWQESGVTMGRMRISPKDWTRGAQVAGRAREAEVTLEDYNSDLRNIVVHDYSRPAETDKARVQGVLASYLSGSPRRTTNLNGSNYVSSSNTVTLPATTYDRTNTAEVLASIAAVTNKLYFVTVDGELFYDGNDSTAYSCPFKISDRDTDLSSTVFAPQPGGFGPASSEDGQQLLSGLWLFYGESQYVHVTNSTVANQYSWWEDVVYDDTVTTSAAATTLANALLAQRAVEDRQIAVRIGPLEYGQAIQIKAGQLIQIKWRAIPDADDAYVSRRITELRWSTPEPFSFFADMILDRPIRLHGQGQKTDTVIPKPAPVCESDTITGATPIWYWTWTTNDNDDGSNTYDGGLDRTVPGDPTYDYPPAAAAFGGPYGRNSGSAYASAKVPISSSTTYSFRGDFLWEFNPSVRDVTLRWYSAADALLRTDTWVEGSGHGTNTKYHEVASFTSPSSATQVLIHYTNFAGLYGDNVYIETPGLIVVADNDEFCVTDPGDSPYYMKSDDPRVLQLIDQMEGVGFSWKMPVRVATTAAGTLASSFEEGDTVDGVVLVLGDRILIKDQAAGETNGIYTVNATGAPTRAVDFESGDQAHGAAAFVSEGTTNSNKVYVCTTNAPIDLDTTALVFAQVSGSSLTVQEDDSTVDAAVTTLDFTTALNVTSSPSGEANIAVDLGTASTQAAAGNHTHTAGDSAKASATADLSGTTSTAADVTGATLSLGAGTYIVAGNFQVEINSGDRVFEGVLDVAGSDENDLAIWEAIGADDGDEQQVTQFWRITLGSTSTVKLQARHSGGSTGDFDVKAANTTITAWTSGGSLGAWTDYTPTLTAVTTNPTLGSSTLTGRYKALDSKTYIVQIHLAVTTGGAWNAGSGEWKFSLPAGVTSGSSHMMGAMQILDSGTARFSGTAYLAGGATVIWPNVVADATGTRILAHNVPVTWATGDNVIITITFEAA